MNKLSNGEIDRIGNNIRKEQFNISEKTLNSLQEYRTSHQIPLVNIFKLICKIGKEICHSSISTYRIKRFESIINKLERYPDMRFSRMWDIAGCRIILKEEKDLYRTIEKIDSNKDLEIIKIKDYIKNPQDDGYRAIHLYLKHTSSDKKIELQIRTLKNHDWATLVEITDLLYNTRLKELGNDKTFLEFHKLLSETEKLNNKEKYKILQILKNSKYIEKLSEVFSKNYLIVRKQWLKQETKTNHRYFLIEVNKNTPNIKSFSSFNDAEKEYYELYKSKENTNIVLTYLQNHNYELLVTAYANYILTFHSFLFECLSIIETLIIDCLEDKKYIKLQQVYNFYNELTFTLNKNILQEIDDSFETQFNDIPIKEKSNFNKKRKLWLKDIAKQIKRITINHNNLDFKLRKRLKKPTIKNLILVIIIKISNRKYKKKNMKIFKNSIVMRTIIEKTN